MNENLLYSKEKYRGHSINIYYDENPDSPREWGTFGTIYSNSRSYNPDNHKFEEILNEEENGLSKEFVQNNIWLKIYGYQHGGLTISCSGGYPYNDAWDSGLFGIIAVSKEDAIKEFGKKICTKAVREKALDCLRGEVKTLNMYYTGDVFGYEIEDADGDVVDSCFGYFGQDSIDDMITKCKDIVDSDIKQSEQVREERIQNVKNNITHLVGNTFYHDNMVFRIGTDKLFGMPVLEQAECRRGAVRDEYYDTVNLSAVPDNILANMNELIRQN